MYLIIGASSFIGVYTANEFLQRGCEIAVTGRKDKLKKYYEEKGVPYYNLDLGKKEDFDQLPRNIDGVVLLSALLPANETADLVDEENADKYIEINTLGTIYLLEFCRKNHIKRVISTISYADVSKKWRAGYYIDETETRDFSFVGDHAAYVISKNAAADMLEYYNQQHHMKNAWFRLPPVYGVGPHGSLLVNGKVKKSGLQIFIDNASEGEDICVYGDKMLSRDVVYVKDVAHAFYLAMLSDETYGLYNITSGHGTTLDEQAEVISKVFAKDKISKVTYKPEIPNGGTSYIFSVEKAKKDFKYIPEYDTFEKMMLDYKRELERGEYGNLFEYRY